MLRTGRARARLGPLADDHTTAAPFANAFGVMACAFFAAGGLAAIAVALLQPRMPHRGAIAALGLVAVLTGIAIQRHAGRLPESLRRALNFSGTTCILAMVWLAGATPGGEALFWLFCFSPLGAFVFFPLRWAAPMVAWVGIATAVVTFALHVMQPVEWFCSLVVGLVLSLTLAWLVRDAAAGDWDAATGMLNRRGVGRVLAGRCAAAEASGRPFAVAMLRVSAGSGNRPPNADALAQRLGARWRALGEARATWARLADLEFAVIWDGSDGIERFLERVREQAGGEVMAVGFCDWRPGVDALALLHDSFEGCGYSARTGGAVVRAGLVQSKVAELRHAIEKGQVVPAFQPIVALPAGRVVGGEALARWQHPVRGMVPPDEFIPLAEHSGLIDELGLCILRAACRAAAGWRRADPDAVVAVNVSGLQLHDPDFPQSVAAALREADLPPANLTIEVTESSLAADDAGAIATLTRLRALGVTVSMDDFGTGYSSLARLATLPIDELKIDRSFVQQIEDRRPLIECVLQLASTVGLRTVVEGVETAGHALAVTAMGADCAQGWLYGRPVAAEDFPLAARNASVPVATAATTAP